MVLTVGKRGPPPLPTALKKLRGTLEKSRANPHEPRIEPGSPPVPQGLDKIAQERWNFLAPKLIKLRVLTEIDGAALEGYCRAYSRAAMADKAVAKFGLVVDTPFGPKKNIAVTISRDSWLLVDKFGAKLGLSPSDRSRVDASPEEEEDPVEKELFGKPLSVVKGGKGA